MYFVENPIRKGFYPDPSVCRVKDTYYCVHSSFAYAPGIPIFKSRDLINWEQIGHVLTRGEQLRLEGAPTSGGIYAPTIRYYRGIFYVIVTNVTHGGNFYVTATDPAGEWSAPYYLEDAEGIDPSLFFEDDKCYYVGQRTKKNAAYDGDCEIWIQELDRKNHCLIGESRSVYDGAFKRAIWPEGPHIYKKDDYYYLLIAEGGTAYEHSICAARSREIYGPYESCPWNPIFTHRHLGHHYPVQNAGHGDLFDTPDGAWYILLLATRPVNGCAELGRETFLADVTWEEDWSAINAGEGKLRHYQPIPWEESHETDKCSMERRAEAKSVAEVKSAVESETMVNTHERNLLWSDAWERTRMELLGLRGNLLWEKDTGCYMEEQRLTMPLLNTDFKDRYNTPAYLGIRLTHRTFIMSTKLTFSTDADQCEAGLLYYYDEKNHIRFGIQRRGNGNSICFVQVRDGEETIKTCSVPWEREYALSIRGQEQKADFSYEDASRKIHKIAAQVDLSYLCSEKAGGFTGCTLGVYGISYEAENIVRNKAIFTDWNTTL